MSAADALRAARAAGLTMRSDGECLLLEASVEPPKAVLDALARHKYAILDLLRPGLSGWNAKDWRAYFTKRCEIAGSKERSPAEAKANANALACCVTEWLHQHPAPSPPGRCAWCGKADPGPVVLPFGTEPGTHAWLHAECWPAWYEARRADAVAALEAMGVAGAI